MERRFVGLDERDDSVGRKAVVFPIKRLSLQESTACPEVWRERSGLFVIMDCFVTEHEILI